MAMALRRALLGGVRYISTTPVLNAPGTKKGKIVQDAKKTGYKKGGKKDKKGGGKESANRKDAGVGASVYKQIMNKPTRVEVKTKVSDEVREKMLAEMKDLAKETSRILMRDLREKQYMEWKQLKLRQAAIAALPEKLRAKVRGLPTIKKTIMPPTLVPPIGGYSGELFVARKEAMARKKR